MRTSMSKRQRSIKVEEHKATCDTVPRSLTGRAEVMEDIRDATVPMWPKRVRKKRKKKRNPLMMRRMMRTLTMRTWSKRHIQLTSVMMMIGIMMMKKKNKKR